MTSTSKTIAKTELHAFWNGGVMMADGGGFLNSCKITGKIYDEWQSAVMRLFSHILTHDPRERYIAVSDNVRGKITFDKDGSGIIQG